MRFLAILIAVVMAIVLVSADPCMKPCARNFDFVCGQFPDGTKKAFSNPCVMEIEAYQKGVGNFIKFGVFIPSIITHFVISFRNYSITPRNLR